MKNVTEVVGIHYCSECDGTLEASYLMKVIPASHDDPGEVNVGDYRYSHAPDGGSPTSHSKPDTITCSECRSIAEELEGCEDMEIAGLEDVEEYDFNGIDRAVG